MECIQFFHHPSSLFLNMCSYFEEPIEHSIQKCELCHVSLILLGHEPLFDVVLMNICVYRASAALEWSLSELRAASDPFSDDNRVDHCEPGGRSGGSYQERDIYKYYEDHDDDSSCCHFLFFFSKSWQSMQIKYFEGFLYFVVFLFKKI